MATHYRPLVSVIIPSHNRAGSLPRAIESVLSQSYAPIETIVVDHGSTDETWDAVTPYLSKIRYFFKEGGGEAGARNLGLAKARGGAVSFLDPEDVWKSDKVEKQVRKLGEGEFGVCIADEEIVDENGSFLRRVPAPGTAGSDGSLLKQYLLNMHRGYCATMLVRRDAADAAGGFDETLDAGQDREYFMRLAGRFRTAVVPEPLVQVTRGRDPAGRRTGAGVDFVVLDRLPRIAPEFARKNGRLIREIKARVTREFAEELVECRYLSEARQRLRESLAHRFAFRALVLYAKTILLDALSSRYPRYRDRGCFNGR